MTAIFAAKEIKQHYDVTNKIQTSNDALTSKHKQNEKQKFTAQPGG